MSNRAEPTVVDADLLRDWPMPVHDGGDKFVRGTPVVNGGSPPPPGRGCATRRSRGSGPAGAAARRRGPLWRSQAPCPESRPARAALRSRQAASRYCTPVTTVSTKAAPITSQASQNQKGNGPAVSQIG